MKMESKPESVKATLGEGDDFEVRKWETSEQKTLVYLEAGRMVSGGTQLVIHLNDRQLFHLQQGIERYFFEKG